MDLKKISKSINNFFAKNWKKWTIFMILAILVYAGYVSYKYVYKPLYGQKEIAAFKLEIRKSVYNELMESYAQKQQTIDNIINKNYLDPFK